MKPRLASAFIVAALKTHPRHDELDIDDISELAGRIRVALERAVSTIERQAPDFFGDDRTDDDLVLYKALWHQAINAWDREHRGSS